MNDSEFEELLHETDRATMKIKVRLGLMFLAMILAIVALVVFANK